MKNLFLLILIFLTSFIYSQNNYKPFVFTLEWNKHLWGYYSRPTNYQFRFVREWTVATGVDSSLHIGLYNGTPVGVRGGTWIGSGELGADTINHLVYIRKGTTWYLVGGGGAGVADRFGKSGEDVLANETRAFDANYNIFGITKMLSGEFKAGTSTNYMDDAFDSTYRSILVNSGSNFYSLELNKASKYWELRSRTGSNEAGILAQDDSLKFNSTAGKYVFTNLVTSGDSTPNKPAMFDQYGRLVKGTYWFGGGGSSQTWQQTLTTGSTLTTGNTITMGTTTFTMNGSTTSNQFYVNNSSSGVAVKGQNDGNNAAIWGETTTGQSFVAIAGDNAELFDGTGTQSNTSTVRTLTNWTLNSSGTAANGFGQQHNYYLETSTANSVLAARQVISWNNATHANRETWIDYKGIDNGTEERFMNIQPTLVRVNNDADTLATKAYARSVGGGGGGGGTVSDFIFTDGNGFDGTVTTSTTTPTLSLTTTVADKQVMFSNGGAITGDADWLYNSSLNLITTTGSVATGTNSAVFSTNAIDSGANTFMGAGQNTVIRLNVNGAASLGTDGVIYATADYSTLLADANEVRGESELVTGFGNRGYVQNGFLGGNDSWNGTLTNDGTGANTYQSAFSFGNHARSKGNHNFVNGRYVKADTYGNAGVGGIILFGSGPNGGSTYLTATGPPRFAVGLNSDTATINILEASGAGTFGTTQINGFLELGTVANDNSETKILTWNDADHRVEYRDVNSISGITTLNTLTGATQTFATGTSGSDFGISSSGTTHTFNIPSASSSARGLVTTGTQSFAGTKNFDGRVTIAGLDDILALSSSLSTTNGWMAGQVSDYDLKNVFSNQSGLTPTAGRDYYHFYLKPAGVTEAGSGTHNLIAGLVIDRLNLTNGSAATNNAASLYILGSPTGSASPTNSYSMWIDSGLVRIDPIQVLQENSAPSAPASGFGYLYASSSDSHLHWYSDNSTDYDLTATGGGGGALDDLTDVTITSVTTGDLLRYNGTAWVNVATIGNSNLTNSTISGISLGSNLATLTFGTHMTGTSYNGSTGVTIATDATTDATASVLMARDAQGNIAANLFAPKFTTTATAAGTTTLTNASTQIQYFTGSSTQTVKLPDVTTLLNTGTYYIIHNESTGAVTVQSSGANTIVILAAGTSAMFINILATGTGTASWDYDYTALIATSGKSLSLSNTLTLAGADGKTLTVNNSITLSGTDATTMTFPSSNGTVAVTNIAQTWTAGIKPSFDADGTNADIRLIGNAGNPSSLSNGDIWYNSTTNKFMIRENSLSKAMTPVLSKSINFTSPTTSENETIWYTTADITIEEVRGVMLGTSQSVTFVINYGDTRDVADGQVVSSIQFDSGETGYQTTGFAFTIATADIPAGNYIWITTSATSGTINNWNTTLTYRQR